MNTLVIQSHRSPLPYTWIEPCLDSVRHWCALNQYEYRFMGDELFDAVPGELLKKTQQQRVVASDIARLLVLRDGLKNGYGTVVWLDADFLIFNPLEFVLPDAPYALGREVWVQPDKQGKLKVHKKVHNAFLMYRKDNSFLDFYIETAKRLLGLNNGSMSPQFIGPKLLTALHNIIMFPVMESAGMLSPMVVKDIIQQGGPALDLFIGHSPQPITGVNLCISSCDRDDVSVVEMERLIECLLNKPVWF